MITSDSKYSSIPHSQIILLGNEKKEELFATMQRNILERWLIRYENLNVEETLNESNQFQVKLTESNEKAHFLSIGLGPDPDLYSEDFNRFEIASLFDQPNQLLLMWLVPEDYLQTKEEENPVESPFVSQLISLGQLSDSIRRSQESIKIKLCFLRITERKSQFGTKPWLATSERQEKMVRESIERQTPNFFLQLVHTFDSIRFQELPWSMDGSHLDYAPRWIDNLIFKEIELFEPTT